jgi:predicted kinase
MRSGRTAVLDATYGSRVRRDAAHKLAKDLGAGALLVETRCARAEALGRLEARQAADRDPSDAGPELYAPIAAAFEAPEEWPDRLRIVVETDHADWENGLRAALASLAPDLRVTSGRTMLVKSPSSE